MAVQSISTSLEQLCRSFLESNTRFVVQLALSEKDRLHEKADDDETKGEDRELENCDVQFHVGSVVPSGTCLARGMGSIGKVTSNIYDLDLQLFKTEQLVAVARGSGAARTGNVLI